MQTESVIYLSILCFILAYTLIKPWLSKDKSQIWSPITMIALTYLYYVVKPSFDDLSRYGANHCTNQSLYYLASLIFFVCVLIAFRKTSTGEFSKWNTYFNTNNVQKFAWKRPGNGVIKKCIAKTCGLFFANEKLSVKIQNWIVCKYAKKNPLEKCLFVTTLKNGEFNKLAPKECFDGYQLLDFEGLKFKGPKDFDTYLHCLYKGDYMQLPPIEKREVHNNEVFWK